MKFSPCLIFSPDHRIKRPLAGPLVAFGLLSVTAAGRADDWPMFRHDPQHTGVSQEALKLPLKRAWTFPTGAQSIFSSAAVVDGSVYFGTRNDPEDASVPAPKETGGGRGSLYCLDAVSGQKKWRFSQYQGVALGGVVSSPAVSGGHVYFSSRDGYFYCLTSEGKFLWRTHTGGTYDSSSPAVVDGKVYFSSGYPNKDFYCLKASDGSVAWKTSSGAGTDKRPGQYAYVSPAVLDGRVYTGSNDAVFYALDAAKGTVKWRYETPGGNPYIFAPTLYKGRLYGVPGEYNPHLYGVDLKTGTESWNFTAPGQYFYISSTAADKDIVYVGMGTPDHTLYAVDAATGVEKWHFLTGFSWIQQFTSSPAISGNLVIVGAGPETAQSEVNGRLFALDASNGLVKWKETLPKPVVASPTVAEGRVFVGASDGVMYAYKDSSAPTATAQSTAKKPSAKPKASVKPKKKGAH